jgi:16S rRNA (cytidine1402-2'-O)-methyltransferase
MLYLVPTPVGNLEDMTHRAVRILGEVSVVLAEDTRTSGRLLKHFGIENRMQAFHAHNEHLQCESLVSRMQKGESMALITDAGTPGISDPGFLLVRACHAAGLPVTCLPGATAMIPAIASSGLPSDKFFFEGFLPVKKGRKTRLAFIAQLPVTVILYESPHRLLRCLEELVLWAGEERMACVCREISKIHEEIRLDTLQNLWNYYAGEGVVKGEIVIVLGAAEEKPEKKSGNKYKE